MKRFEKVMLMSKKEMQAVQLRCEAQVIRELFLKWNSEGYADQSRLFENPDMIDSERPLVGRKIS